MPVWYPQYNSFHWIVQNVGGSNYMGAELDLTAAVTEGLRFSVSSSWLDHEYTSYVIEGVEHSGETRLIVPTLSYSASVDYRFPDFGLPGLLEGSLSVSHTDEWSTPYTPSVLAAAMGQFDPSWLTTPAYTLWNARLALTMPEETGSRGKGQISVALWVQNLADKKYLSAVTMSPAAASLGLWGEPRTFGVDVTYRY